MKPVIPDYGWITYGERVKMVVGLLGLIFVPTCLLSIKVQDA